MFEPFSYPARIEEPQPGQWLVTFRDVPEAITGGASHEEALSEAADALTVALEGYLSDDRPLPARSARIDGETDVAVEPRLAALVVLHRALAASGLSRRALADRLGKDEKVVRRMLSGEASFEQTLRALAALGVRPALAVQDDRLLEPA